jgi:DNA topoisomerase-3
VRHALYVGAWCALPPHFSPLLSPHSLAPTLRAPGHLLEYEFGSEYKSWASSDSGELISRAPLFARVRDKHQHLEQMLLHEARHAQWLILWLDCDREGEAIAEEVRPAVSAACPCT